MGWNTQRDERSKAITAAGDIAIDDADVPF
jgi:hypothetical protein